MARRPICPQGLRITHRNVPVAYFYVRATESWLRFHPPRTWNDGVRTRIFKAFRRRTPSLPTPTCHPTFCSTYHTVVYQFLKQSTENCRYLFLSIPLKPRHNSQSIPNPAFSFCLKISRIQRTRVLPGNTAMKICGGSPAHSGATGLAAVLFFVSVPGDVSAIPQAVRTQ